MTDPTPDPHETGAPKARRGAFRIGLAATLAAFAIVVVVSLSPSVGTYAEGWVLAAELGVIVLFLAGLGWIVAAALRQRK